MTRNASDDRQRGLLGAKTRDDFPKQAAAPREVAASRTAKRYLAAAASQVWGPMTPNALKTAELSYSSSPALADGVSTLTNAASEPHVQDLCTVLSGMGADIEGRGTSMITVRGVPVALTRPKEPVASQPGRPPSAELGISGAMAVRSRAAIPSTFTRGFLA